VEALAVETDVSKQEQVQQLAEAAISQYQRIDVWVNNAGVGALGRFEQIPLADHLKVIETDLLGTLFGSYFAIPHFLEQGGGILINISSMAGKVPPAYYTSYAAAKAGVLALGKALREELRQNNIENIHVCTVIPTSFDTAFFEHASNYTSHQKQPIGKVYEPEKVIDVIVELATDPEDEVTVGTSAKIMSFAEQVTPGVAERMMGKEAHDSMIKKSARPVITKAPMRTGPDVRGGRKT
jgi:short-subunit dehydrogenase